MTSKLAIDFALRTEAGDKAENADAADVVVPRDAALQTKGIAAAIADGMSSSEGGKQAAHTCVSGFLSDYYSTPESWTVKNSATKILGALNSWLFSQGQMRYDSAKGMVTTFTGLVIKSTTAHIFHVGDTRIYQYRQGELEQLTRDHRVWVSKERDFLSRAMGIDAHVDIDYRSVAVEPEDIFLFVTDGVSGHITDNRLTQLIAANEANLQSCASAIMEEALHNGSTDNVTCQLIKVIETPTQTEDEILQKITELPFPPELHPGMSIDGYTILHELHASKRSEVFLVKDEESGEQLILKTPSINYRDEPAFLEGFLHEEWIGRRINNIHVLKVLETPRRRFLYNISEYVKGQTLRQWIDDHPQTHINKARDFLKQIADGLRAFHRLEMIHLDLKPDNILLDENEILKIIDFGSTRVAGTSEIETSYDKSVPQGTINYSAPECIEGVCSNRSDIFSLGIIAYELLTGELPYASTEHPQPAKKLRYRSARQFNSNLAEWVDEALKKAVHPDASKRYDTMSEFLYDLNKPNPAFVQTESQPLMERNPLVFWKSLSAALFIGNLFLLYLHFSQ